MNREAALRWWAFLNGEEDELKQRPGLRKHVAYGDGSVSVAEYLASEAALLRDSLDAAVREFAKSGAWPEDLRPEQVFHLVLRIGAAQILLHMIATGKLTNEELLREIPPPSAQRSTVIVWLLIRVWDLAREVAIKAFTENMLRAGYYYPTPPEV